MAELNVASTTPSANAQPNTPAQDPSEAQPKNPAQEPSNAQGVATAAPKADAALTQGGSNALKKFKLKIDGQEEEVDENEIVKRAQMGTAAYKRMQEAAREKAIAEEMVGKFRTNFTDLLDDPRLGFTEEQKIKMIEDWYKRRVIEPATLTPEQLKARQNELELKKYRDAEKAREQQEHQQRLQMLEEHHMTNYKAMIKEGLAAEGLPQNEFCAKRMVQLVAKNVKLGLDLTPAQIASIVREDYQNELKSVLGASDGDVLLKLLGDDVANKIRKADLARLRAGTFKPAEPQATPGASSSAQKPNGFKRLDDHLADVMKRIAG